MEIYLPLMLPALSALEMANMHWVIFMAITFHRAGKSRTRILVNGILKEREAFFQIKMKHMQVPVLQSTSIINMVTTTTFIPLTKQASGEVTRIFSLIWDSEMLQQTI